MDPSRPPSRARVIDDDGAFNEYVASVVVTNVAPTPAVVNLPAAPKEGDTISFDVTISEPSSADRSAGLGQSWSVVRGDTQIAAGGGSHGSFSATDDGTYAVTVTATDKDGGRGTVTTNVTVAGVAPVATPNIPAATTEGSPVTIGLSGATDPSPADVTAGLRYQLTCGGTLPAPAYGSASTTPSTSCLYDDETAATVALRVIDKDGRFTDYTGSIAVQGVAPTAVFDVPAEVVVGEPAQLRLLAPSDASTADRAAGFTYAFDCGSGFGSASGTTAAQCAVPSIGGTVAARIQDKDGIATTYRAFVSARPNLLANGGLETDANGDGAPEGWTVPAGTWTAGHAHSGNRGFTFTSSTARTWTAKSTSAAAPRARYTARAWIDLPTAASSAQLRIRWYNSSGTLLKTSALPVVSGPTSGWRLLSGDATAPAGSTSLAADVVVTTNGSTASVDDVAVIAGNQLVNGDLETDANADGRPDSWYSLSRFTRDATLSHSGAASGKVAGDGSTVIPRQRVDFVQSGRSYVLSTWVQVPQAGPGLLVRPRVRWYSSGQTVISVQQLTASVSAATPGWVQLSGTVVAPANTTAANIEISVAGSVDVLRLDDVYFAPVG